MSQSPASLGAAAPPSLDFHTPVLQTVGGFDGVTATPPAPPIASPQRQTLTEQEVASRRQLIALLARRREELLRELKDSTDDIFSTIRAHRLYALQVLLDVGVYSVGTRDAETGYTPLHEAAANGLTDVCAVLIAHKADPFATLPTDDQAYPSRLADRARHFETRNYLWKHEAKVSSHRASIHHQRTPSGALVGRDAFGASFGPSVTGPPPDLIGSTTGQFGHSANEFASGRGEMGFAQTSIVFPGHLGSSPPLFGTSVTGTAESNFQTVSDTVSIVVCMVGLPGRGKSYISKHLARYLNWKGVACRVFNAGNYRRKFLGATETAEASFFDPDNPVAKQQREQMAQMAAADARDFVNNAAQRGSAARVAILDATNTTKVRRSKLVEFFRVEAPAAKVMFIESVCTNSTIVHENILRAKCGNDDFADANPKEVVEQFNERIRQYEKVYETLDAEQESSTSFIKITDVKDTVLLHNVAGAVPTRMSYFLINLACVQHPVYVVISSETNGDLEEEFSDSDNFTATGHSFVKALGRFVKSRCRARLTAGLPTTPELSPCACGTPSASPAAAADASDNAFSVLFSPHSKSAVGTIAAARRDLEGRSNIAFHETSHLNDVALGTWRGLNHKAAKQRDSKEYQRLFESVTHDNMRELGGQYPPHLQPLFNPSRHDFHVRKYTASYPQGESCRQVNQRIEPVIFETLRAEGPVMIVAKPTPAQGVLAYLCDIKPEHSPFLCIPRHVVLEIGTKGTLTFHSLLAPTASSPGAAFGGSLHV